MTPHFALTEFTRSDTAARRSIINALPQELIPAAVAALEMMERIRAFLSQNAARDTPISITSGYRCPQLNMAIGSSSTSDHPKACAVDWRAPSFGAPTEICKALAPMVGVLGIGQLINEYPDADGWVHTSTLIPAKAVNRIITITRTGIASGIFGA